MVMVVSLNCTNAFGSYITMATGYSVIKKAEGPVLVVMAENRGDEPPSISLRLPHNDTPPHWQF